MSVSVNCGTFTQTRSPPSGRDPTFRYPKVQIGFVALGATLAADANEQDSIQKKGQGRENNADYHMEEVLITRCKHGSTSFATKLSHSLAWPILCQYPSLVVLAGLSVESGAEIVG